MRVYRNDKLRALNIDFAAPRAGDAGYDVFSVGDYTLAPGQRQLIETGLHLEIPPGYVALVKDRSSIAAAGLHSLAGVIDSSYRGEVKILLVNLGTAAYSIRPSQKIAQLLILPVYTEKVELVESLEHLSASQRGTGGFGSTGE